MAHKFRLFATGLAVTLGVAFTAGTLLTPDDRVGARIRSGRRGCRTCVRPCR